MLSHQNFSAQDWALQAKEYEHNKKILPWGHTTKPEVVTTKIIKEKDNIFVPILQTYKAKDKENNTQNNEKNLLKHQLARNKVNKIII